MEFTETGHGSDTFQTDIFHVMGIDIFQSLIELLNIFLLLVRTDINKQVVGINMVFADLYKNFKHFCMNDKLGIFAVLEVFNSNLNEHLIDVIVYFGKFFLSNKKRVRKQGLYSHISL